MRESDNDSKIAYCNLGMRRRGNALSTLHLQFMTPLERFEAAFAALPPLPEEVRTAVLVIWLEVVSGRVDLPTLRELCRENIAQPGGHRTDAMMLDLVDQLIMHGGPGLASPAARTSRQPRSRNRTSFRSTVHRRSRRRRL